MRNSISILLARLVIIAGILILVAIHAPALANDKSKQPIKVELSLFAPSVTTLGEPISLNYSIINLSDQKIGMRLGAENRSWYTLTLLDETGKPVPAIKTDQPQQALGAFAMPDPFLSPSGARNGSILVTQRFLISHPGEYTLRVYVGLRYTVVEPTESSPLDLAALLDATGTVYNSSATFPFVVKPANSGKLRATAEALEEAITNEKDSVQRRALIGSLFSMPEAQAYVTWTHFADYSPLDASLITTELKKMHTAKAVDIMIRMLANSAITKEHKDFIKQTLNQIYGTSDDTLKAHIQRAGARVNLRLSGKEIMPTAVD